MSIPPGLENLTPQPLIGGSAFPQSASTKDFSVGVKIDWISVTIPRYIETEIYPPGLSQQFMDTVPAKGYTTARVFPDGRRESVNVNRPDMGRHIVYSGSCLNTIAEQYGLGGISILKFYWSIAAKFTRLDVAVDALNSGFSIGQAYSHLQTGKAPTAAKKWQILDGGGETTGKTLYIGSRKSEAFARIYDKAAEAKVSGDWIRFEMEYKDSKAEQVASLLIQQAQPPREIIQACLRGFVDFPKIPEYRRIMTANPKVIVRAKDTQSDTFKWLMETCAPVLARLSVERDDPYLIDHFIAVAEEARQKLIAQKQSSNFIEADQV